MRYDPRHIASLLFKQLAGTLTAEERAALDNWRLGATERGTLIAEIEDEEKLSERARQQAPEHFDAISERMLARINQAMQGKDMTTGNSSMGHAAAYESDKSAQRVVHRVHFLRTAWFRVAVAVILAVGLGVMGYYLITRNNNRKEITKADQGNRQIHSNSDILPGSNKAVLTLSDGRRVELDSATSGTIQDQALSIDHANGQLVYSGKRAKAVQPNAAMTMNTMTTPKGGQYQLTLADGSRVWLNAASSITYSTAFTGAQRRVKVEGEAYFEVAANAKQPFVVETVSDTIIVLGTAFNVHAYADEAEVKTSLLNGSVNVNDTNIQPGQAYSRGKVTTTNIDQDIAWKNGFFNMHGADISTVMNAISRWYDVDVIYKRTIPGKFVVHTRRNNSLEEVLKILQATGTLSARIEGRTVIIQ